MRLNEYIDKSPYAQGSVLDVLDKLVVANKDYRVTLYQMEEALKAMGLRVFADAVGKELDKASDFNKNLIYKITQIIKKHTERNQ